MRLIEDSPEARARYNDAFRQSPTASVYHSLEWLEVLGLLSYEFLFIEIDDHNLIPFLAKGKGPLRRAFSLPLDTYGGPVLDVYDPIPMDAIARALDIPSIRVADFHNNLDAHPSAKDAACSYVVDLTRRYEEVYKSYSKRNREALRQSKRRGVSVRLMDGPSLLPAFYSLYQFAVRKHNRMDLGFDFLKAIFETMVPKNLARFYLARHEGQPVAGNLVLRAKSMASDWANGYRDEFLNLRPNNALIDTAINHEIASGTKLFNLGASPPDHPGMVRFKKGFGAAAYTYVIVSRTNFFYRAARKARRGALASIRRGALGGA